MSDLFEDEGPAGAAGPGANAHEFTVSEISGAVKRALEGEFSHVRVRGEVGRVHLARTGHLYFDLKDERNVLAAVSWKGQLARLAHRPEEGMEVIATGRLTTFGPQSKYQLNVEQVEPAGEGALMAMLEKRRRALAAEGLFAVERKKPLPFLPEVIGVITSPQGAVIRDILHRLRDRFPRRVLVWPVAVQGAACAPQVAAAIAGFNSLPAGGPIPRPDLLIVARGGGSVEDLWGFNEEIVVRAAAASRIPLISAVGHETDTTLIDHAADRRAPTPSAAAEIAVPVRSELLARLAESRARLARALAQGLERRGQRLRDLARALPRPERLTETARQRLDRAEERLGAALLGAVQRKRVQLMRQAGGLGPALLLHRIERQRERLADRAGRLPAALGREVAARRRAFEGQAARLRPQVLPRRLEELRAGLGERLDRLRLAAAGGLGARRQRLAALERVRQSVGYVATLGRGYAVVRAGEKVLTSAQAAAAAPALEIEFHDGCLSARADTADSATGGKLPETERPAAGEAGQAGAGDAPPRGREEAHRAGRARKSRAAHKPDPGDGQGSLF